MKNNNSFKSTQKKIWGMVILGCFSVALHAAQIGVLGCGYVGLTLSAVLGSLGHDVVCFDVDQAKIATLHSRALPFYEPDVDTLINKGVESGNISFTSSLNDLHYADIFYICVGTPTNAQGQCDCTYLYAAIDGLMTSVIRPEDTKIICVKSTLPPGTMNNLQTYLYNNYSHKVKLVYNPEFMREGTALQDMSTNNPIVIGGVDNESVNTIEHIYDNFITPEMKVIKTNFETAELIKYAWNSFSAIRIAYVNELALLSRKIGADIATAVEGFALSEQLLPTSVIRPGPGYGGSCLPKDTTSFANLLECVGFSATMIHQAIKSNNKQKQQVVNDIMSVLNLEQQPTVALLGLAFKANTDDIRYASAITIIEELLAQGVIVKAYDPKAMLNMGKLFPQVQYCDSAYDAASQADCIVILTEWQEIKNLCLEQLARVCRNRIIVDTRNIYDPQELQKHGFSYINMGRL